MCYSKKHHERTTPAQPRRYCPPPPPPLRPARLPHRFPGLECSPRYHIGFLKTHRCGSSAVQNILFRFAAHHRLVPLLPPSGSHMLGDRPFHASDRCDTYNHQLGYHIINVALRWNHPEVCTAPSPPSARRWQGAVLQYLAWPICNHRLSFV